MTDRQPLQDFGGSSSDQRLVSPALERYFDQRYTVRLSLSRQSLIAELIRCAHYSPTMPSHQWFADSYGQVVRCFRQGDPGRLVRETLLMAGERLIATDVDLTNTQFLGASLDGTPFCHGYEPEILAVMERFLPRDGVFYDVGANWGYFALHLLLDPAFHGRVVAVEPVTQSYRDLVRLVDLVGGTGRCQLLNVAAGDAIGFARISDDPWSGNQSLATDRANGELVRIARLDDLGLFSPDLIKLDVEGFEAEALRGAAGLISEHHPAIIFENWYSTDKQQVAYRPFEMLLQHGYSFYLPEAIIDLPSSERVPFSVVCKLKLVPITMESRPALSPRINVLALCSRHEQLLERKST